MAHRLLLTVALLAALGAVGAAPAPAAEPAPGVAFALQPVGFQKGFFRFNTEPGETRTAELAVINVTDREIAVRLAVADVGTAAQGGLEFGDDQPRKAGRWLELSEDRVEIAPGRRALVDVTLRVPEDPRPGEHFAGVVAIDEADLRRVRTVAGADGTSVRLRFLPRIAVTALVRLPGAGTPVLETEPPSIESTPTGAFLTLPVRNPGTARVPRTTGRVTVTDGDGRRFTQLIRLDTFVPDSDVRLRIPWQGRPERGTYRVTGVLRPEGGDDVPLDHDVDFGPREGRAFEAQTGVDLPDEAPWWRWIAIVAAGVLVLLAALAARRRASGRDGRAVDLNRAAPEDLATLPGVGVKAAERIVAHRDEYGEFSSVDDLAGIDGFDPERVDRLRPRAKV